MGRGAAHASSRVRYNEEADHADSFMVIGHTNPDHHLIGSALALTIDPTENRGGSQRPPRADCRMQLVAIGATTALADGSSAVKTKSRTLRPSQLVTGEPDECVFVRATIREIKEPPALTI